MPRIAAIVAHANPVLEHVPRSARVRPPACSAGQLSRGAVAWRPRAELPFDVRLATALGHLVNAQRAQIETADLERRLAALGKTTRPALRRVP